MDCLIFIKEISSILFSLAACGIAFYGLFTWKRQLRGNAEYDLAKRILKTLYQARDTIRYIRSRFIWSAEAISAIKKFSATPEQDLKDFDTIKISTSYVYDDRWSRYAAISPEIQTLFYEAEALWGQQCTPLISRYTKLISELRFALSEYIKHLDFKKTADPELSSLNPFDKELEKIVLEYAEDDAYNVSVNKIISDFEIFLRKFILSQSHN